MVGLLRPLLRFASPQSSLDHLRGMDFFDNRYYGLNRRLLILIGLWPQQRKTIRLSKGTFILSYMLFTQVVVIKAFMVTTCTLEFLGGLLPPILMYMITVFKYSNAWINRKKIWHLFNHMKHDWQSLKSKEELDIIRTSAEEGRIYILRLTVFVSTIVFLIMLSFGSAVLLNNLVCRNGSCSHKFLYTEGPFAEYEVYFYPIVIHTILVTFLGTIMMTANDNLYACYVQHACGLFRLAGYRLKHSLDKKKRWMSGVKETEALRAGILFGITSHKTAITFTNEINACYAISHFITFGLLLVAITISLFSTVNTIGKAIECEISALLAFSSTTYACVILHPGQKLKDDSAQILEKMYDAPWYNTPKNIQKLIVLVVQKSLTPSTMVAGSLIPFCMATYTSVMRTCLSYFTALCSLR